MPTNKQYAEAQALKDMDEIIRRFKATMRDLETRRASLVKRIATRKDKDDADRTRSRIKSKK